jgi:succinoglycan biosynthesis transport protein ExoP
MPRPIPGDHYPSPPAAVGVNGYTPPPAANGQYAPNPFAVATPTAPPPAGGRALPTITELLSAFKRRWPLALMIGVVVAGLMAAAIWLAMPSGKHRVQATLQFKSTLTNLLGGNTDLNQDQFNKQMEGHKKYMESKDFLDRVVGDSKVSALPSIAGTPAEERANVIRGMFTFKRETDEIVTLTLNGDDPDEMKVILDTMVTEYIAKGVSDEKNDRKKTLADLEKSLEDVQKKIDARRQAIKDKKGAAGETDPIVRGLLLNRIASTEQGLNKAKGESLIFKKQRDLLAQSLTEGTFPNDPADLEEVFKSSTQVAEKQKLFQEAKRRAAQAEAFVPGDPARVEAEAAVKAAAKAVTDAQKDAVAGSADSLKAKQKARLQNKLAEHDQAYQLAQQTAEELQKQLDKLVQEEKGQKSDSTDVANAEKDIEPLVNSKADLLKQKNDLELIERNSSPRIVIIDKPEIYKNFNLKQKSVFAAVAAIAGLLAVCLLVSYVEWRNRRVDGVDQVVAELGMRVIGTIPAFPSRAALRAGETGANQNWRFILNESVNSTRTMLLHTARTQQMQVILVTSAMQGEGKTSLSSQLATSMATAGLRTLILDCDMRNPSMQKLFDVPVSPGCAEILLQEIDISDAVQQTSVPNLSIIPAGQCNHRVIAALAQGHPIEALLNRLRGQYDIIIVDSCPILPVADTLLIAQHVDGVVFSILQDVSQLPKVQDASDRLVQLNIPLLGAVVNGIKPDIQAYGYNYVKQLPA